MSKVMDEIEEILTSKREEISEGIDAALFQDSFSWRSCRIARLLAVALIDEEGQLKQKGLQRALHVLEEGRFSLGKGHYHDAVFMNHLKKSLTLLQEDAELRYALKRIARPEANQVADRLIRSCLHLEENAPLKDFHAKRAALSALFSFLRQNVGSCFATAPAIRIQREQPKQLLADIGQLFGTGRLKRIFEGVEYTVPFSISFGVGDLLKPITVNQMGEDAALLLANSYSLTLPLTRAGVLGKEEGAFQKLLKKSGLLARLKNSFVVLTAEELFKKLLLTHYKLSLADIEKTRESFGFGMMRQMPYLRGNKVMQKERFTKAFKIAKESFVALTDNPLLKAWEFTLASLSESKADFAKWNVSVSLGLDPNEPHGVGQILHEKIQEKIAALNEEIEEMQRKYEALFAQAKQIEVRLKRGSEREQSWLQADYNVRKLEIDHALRLRDEAYEKGAKLRELFGFMLRFYQEKCQEYFQEVYDPEMHDVSLSPYDDTPAGFRLLYKHGRKNPASWSYIYTLEEYSEALRAFFTATEVELSHSEEVQGLTRELGELVTATVLGIKEEAFLKASFYRLAKAYKESVLKEPLEHLDKVKRKPWAYVSGGTMTTLISCYYGLREAPQEVTRWVESETELLAFYLDTMKELPLSVQKRFLEEQSASLLAFSPTHAFLLQPGMPLFRRGWETNRYSYTWIRDDIVNPAAKFIAALELDREMLAYLTKKLVGQLPLGYRSLVENKLMQMNRLMPPMQYHEEALLALSYEKWMAPQLGEVADLLDGILYESLPFLLGHEVVGRVQMLCNEIAELDEILCAKVVECAARWQRESGRYELLSAWDLLQLTKSFISEVRGDMRIHFDVHLVLQRAMQKLGFALREPLIVGDTNWVKNRFGFCVNPGTLQLEFWRLDYAGSTGRPISIWKEHLNGTSKGSWGLLTNPTQYSS